MWYEEGAGPIGIPAPESPGLSGPEGATGYFGQIFTGDFSGSVVSHSVADVIW